MDEKEKKNHPPEGMREEKQSGHLKPAAGAGNREEMKVLRIGDRAYPELLRHIPDPPEILYAMGDTRLLRKKCVAVVGARKASSYGKWVSYNIGRRLAEYDIVTVSGMPSAAIPKRTGARWKPAERRSPSWGAVRISVILHLMRRFGKKFCAEV